MHNTSLKRLVFIRSGTTYQKFIRELSEDLLETNILPFMGAGVSCEDPSNLPQSSDLSDPLQKAMRSAGQLIEKDNWGAADNHLNKARLERLLDVLQRTHGRSAVTFLSVLNGKVWNANHSWIAAFAKKGWITDLVTLNFDLLFEKAVAAYHCSSRTSCPLIHKEFLYGTGPQALSILKPHGSFSPTSSDPFEYLSATMEDVGTEPSPLNERALATVLQSHRTVLVAGYSDNDWDIFPLLGRLVPAMGQRIVWITHSERNAITGQYPNDWRNRLQERVDHWLRDIDSPSDLLVGNVRELLKDVANHIKNEHGVPITFRKPLKRSSKPLTPDATPFMPDGSPTSERSLRTLTSLAMLLQSTGEFSDHLLEYLRGPARDAIPPDVSWKIEHTLSNWEHDRGSMRQSIAHMRRALAIKNSTLGADSVDHDYVWLGYKYLCRTKWREPSERLLTWLFQFPANLVRGLWHLRRGSRMPKTMKAGHDLNVATARHMAQYYLVDLLHTWATILLLGGSRLQFVYNGLFRFIASLYGRLAQKTALFEYEYYYLRFLEARLLSGVKLHDMKEVLRRLDELEHSYRITQNDVQLGNTFSYRALIAALIHHDRDGAKELLKIAEDEWKRGGRLMASGVRRVNLFRRFII